MAPRHAFRSPIAGAPLSAAPYVGAIAALILGGRLATKSETSDARAGLAMAGCGRGLRTQHQSPDQVKRPEPLVVGRPDQVAVTTSIRSRRKHRVRHFQHREYRWLYRHQRPRQPSHDRATRLAHSETVFGGRRISRSVLRSSRLLKKLLRLRNRGGRRDFLSLDAAHVQGSGPTSVIVLSLFMSPDALRPSGPGAWAGGRCCRRPWRRRRRRGPWRGRAPSPA